MTTSNNRISSLVHIFPLYKGSKGRNMHVACAVVEFVAAAGCAFCADFHFAMSVRLLCCFFAWKAVNQHF
jgi:hypothetical protein